MNTRKPFVLDTDWSKTHDKHVTTEPGFMFHDLYGKPMWVGNSGQSGTEIQVVRWTPKKKA